MTGLRILNIERHHLEFRELISEHPLINKNLFDCIDKTLSDWQTNHGGTREGMLWFCLSRHLVDDGTEKFFQYFGGEAIYWPFIFDPKTKDIANLLEQIGEPVVVEVRLSVSNLNLSGFCRRFLFLSNIFSIIT